MQVAGRHIEYTMYIEGIKVPFLSFAAQVGLDYGAVMTFDLLPTPFANRLVRGMKVHLFKREGTEDPVLRFMGIIKNRVYSKTRTDRSIKISVGFPDCRWETIVFSEFDHRNIGCVDEINSMFVSGEGEIPIGSGPVIKSVTTGSPQLSTHFPTGGSPGTEAGSPKIKVQGISYDQNRTSNTAPVRHANQYDFLKDSFPILYDTVTYTPSILDLTPPTMKKEMLSNPIEIEVKAPTSTKAAIMVNIEAAAGDILAGLITTVTQAYEKSNDYNRLEYDRLKMGHMMRSMSVTGMDGSTNLLQVSDVALASSSGVKEGLLRYLDQLVGEASGSTPLQVLVHSILSAIFCHKSVDPTVIDGAITLHPNMLSFIPPACNVLFPNQYSSIVFNPNMWADPTRSLVMFPSFQKFLQSSPGVTGQKPKLAMYLCDTADPDLRHIRSFEPPGGKTDGKLTILNLSTLLTAEETIKGQLCHYESVRHDFYQSLKPSAAMMLADFMHYLNKLGSRSCSVRGELIDDLIVGMPILVLDSAFSIYGILQSFSYSVDNSGSVMTDIDIAFPLYVYSETDTVDKYPSPPMWLRLDELSPANIGTTLYTKFYGCDSIFSKNIPMKDASLPRNVMMYCVQSLQKSFDESQNREEFVRQYRSRRTTTLHDVMVGKHGAKPVSASGSADVLMWSGGDFRPYQLDLRGQIMGSVGTDFGGKLAHPLVDHQGVVQQYLQDYYGKPGRFEK